jgi:DNA helicase IV
MVDPPIGRFAAGRFAQGACAIHPELEAEQAHIDRSYERLEATRREALRLQDTLQVGKGGTEQARWEREVFQENIAQRLAQLHLGDTTLVFGRIDREPEAGGDTFYIGRAAVSDEDQEPLVVDWRAPVAEPFYRALGSEPMGLQRRRHFATRGRTLVGIEDELFGDIDALATEDGDGRLKLQGEGALIAALETARRGHLTDIVATIQAEQDEIIRSPLPGVLVVQGGPGTGKTVVALHRAAYLLYTHRFPLEGQGLLVVGPNRLFLGYIERVLPSLGEAGVELAVLDDLVPERPIQGYDPAVTARIKGDNRMVGVLERALRDRERGLREELRVGYGLQTLRVPVETTRRIAKDARRRFRSHNPARRFVEKELFAALAASSRAPVTVEEVSGRLHKNADVREALEWMWPVLSAGQLLTDLFGSKALLRSAGREQLSDDEQGALFRPRVPVDDVVWTLDDVPLLDEARVLLGRKPGSKADSSGLYPDETRTYGHLVVDEAQDLSPMQLRMIGRRSLNGSITMVGDIAQATGAWAHNSWPEVLQHLVQRREPRFEELTVGYRLPAATTALAARVLSVAAPDLTPPRSVRQGGDPPSIVGVGSDRPLGDAVAEAVLVEMAAIEDGSVAVIAPASLVDAVSAGLDANGIDHGRATRAGLEHRVTVVPVRLVKGLELDSAVVVEPAAIVEEESQGLRALYVALTRATKRLALVHARPLPDALAE